MKSLDRKIKDQSKDYFKGKLSPEAEQLHQTILSLAYNRVLPEKSQLKKLAKDEKHIRHFLIRLSVNAIKPQILGNLEQVAKQSVADASELYEYLKLLSEEIRAHNQLKFLIESVDGKTSELEIVMSQEQDSKYSEAQMVEIKRKVNKEKQFKSDQIDGLLSITRDAENLVGEQKKQLELLRDEVNEEKIEFDKITQVSGAQPLKKISAGMVLQKRDNVEEEDDQPPEITDEFD